jgi:2-dehydropantoate 2-reductase
LLALAALESSIHTFRTVPEKDIVAVCRSNHEIASTDGFKLHSAVWGEILQVKPIIVATAAEAVLRNEGRQFDYILISSKCIGPPSTWAEMIRPAATQGTVIILLQNGIGIEQPYALLYLTNPIISAVVYIPCNQLSPGVIRHNDVQHLHTSTYPSKAPQSHKATAALLATILTSGGASVQVHEDMQVERWSKAIINSAWNLISSLSRSGDASFLASNPDALRMVKDVMLEVAAVAQACGYPMINAEFVDRQIGRAAVRQKPGVKPSMMIDAVQGRSMEVNAIVGTVITFASEKSVETPLLRTIFFVGQSA